MDESSHGTTRNGKFRVASYRRFGILWPMGDGMTDTLELTTQGGSTLADLLDELGVPADRVLRHPHPGTATEADFLYANERLGILCELIDGTLVEKAMGSYESLVGAVLLTLMNSFVMTRKLGVVLGADSMIRLFSGNLRMPDVCFIPKENFPQGLPKGPIWKIVPSLVVEVISASNTIKEIKRKRTEFFSHGTSLFWVIDPATRSAMVYDQSNPIEGKTATDVLDGENALPVSLVTLSELFSVMDL
jgi:Uma2 family endonuclease